MKASPDVDEKGVRPRGRRLEDRLGRARVDEVLGREHELSTLGAQLAEAGAVVTFLYGIGGIGKTALLAASAPRFAALGARVVKLEGRDIEPTPAGFLGALAARLGAPELRDAEALAAELERDAAATVIVVDEYDRLRLLDSWLRQTLLPALPERTRWILAGRFAPRSAWSMAPGWADAVLALKLGELNDVASRQLLARRGIPELHMPELLSLARGTPLALSLVTPRSAASAGASNDGAVLSELAQRSCDSLDAPLRAALEAACLLRRATRPLLEPMLGEGASELLQQLAELSFVEYADDGLTLHEVVRQAVASRLRALDPERHLQLRRIAWRTLEKMIDEAAPSGPHAWRLMADLLFVVDHPEIREAFFPTEDTGLSIDDALLTDREAVMAIVARHEAPAFQAIAQAWWELGPRPFRVAKDASGTVHGFAIIAPAHEIAGELAALDPLLPIWLADLRQGPGRDRGALFMRRTLSAERGEEVGEVSAAVWLDIKRAYVEHPSQWALFVATRGPERMLPICKQLGFKDAELRWQGEGTLRLEFGAVGIWSWLRRLVNGTELGRGEGAPTAATHPDTAAPPWYLCHAARALIVEGEGVALSALEYQTLSELEQRAGGVVSRDELLDRVWRDRNTGSNVVDAVVRLLRKKLGPHAGALETVRGHGYRLCPSDPPNSP